MKTKQQKIDDYYNAITALRNARNELLKIERDNSNASLIEVALGDVREHIRDLDYLHRELVNESK